MRKLYAILAILAVAAFAAPGGEAVAERLSDKQVRQLLDDIRTEIGEFENAVDPQVRSGAAAGVEHAGRGG